MLSSTTSGQRSAVLALMFGAILGLLLLCVPGSVLFYFALHPIMGLLLGGFSIAGLVLGIFVFSHSVARTTVGVVCILAGTLTSVVPPFAPVLRAASSWIIFPMYKSDLDKQVRELSTPRDADVVKVTAENMMLMSKGYAYAVNGQKISGDLQWASKLGIPCVHVRHLYGRYYAWYSSDCND